MRVDVQGGVGSIDELMHQSVPWNARRRREQEIGEAILIAIATTATLAFYTQLGGGIRRRIGWQRSVLENGEKR